ncbi:hypothetical protein ABPG72_015201 [Tetrahymena utriculariae]
MLTIQVNQIKIIIHNYIIIIKIIKKIRIKIIEILTLLRTQIQKETLALTKPCEKELIAQIKIMVINMIIVNKILTCIILIIMIKEEMKIIKIMTKEEISMIGHHQQIITTQEIIIKTNFKINKNQIINSSNLKLKTMMQVTEIQINNQVNINMMNKSRLKITTLNTGVKDTDKALDYSKFYQSQIKIKHNQQMTLIVFHQKIIQVSRRRDLQAIYHHNSKIREIVDLILIMKIIKNLDQPTVFCKAKIVTIMIILTYHRIK